MYHLQMAITVKCMKRNTELSPIHYAIHLLLPTILMLSFASCSTRAYEGAKRESGDVSRIFFSGQRGATINSMTVDGYGIGLGTNIEVLPGKHTFKTGFSTSEHECALESYGCGLEVYKGVCEGSVISEAGHDYSIEISVYRKDISTSVTDKVTQETSGAGHCSVIKAGFAHDPERPQY